MFFQQLKIAPSYGRPSPTFECEQLGGYRLRSSPSSSLIVSRTRLSTVDDRAFPVAAARVWNSLLDPVTYAPSVAVFRSLYRQQITLTVQCSWKLQKVKQTGYQQLGVRVPLSVADTKHNSPSPHPASVLSAAVHGSFSALREATDRTSSSWKTVTAISILSQSSWHPCATPRKGL